MKAKREVHAGHQFGRLTVIGEAPSLPGSRNVVVRCTCGSVKTVRLSDLYKNTKSCGCLNRERMLERNFKHGMRHSPEYETWRGMKSRCMNRNDASYHHYGGRGIQICDRWKSFKNFHDDMGPRPQGMSLDRIDNSGNYTPENCRWATAAQQANNTRHQRLLTFGGKTQSLTKWSIDSKIPLTTLFHRLKRGIPLEKAMSS